MEDLTFEIIDNNHQIKKYELLLSFTNKDINYLVYTDNTYNENDELNIYSSRYEIVNEKVTLSDLTKEEYEIVNQKILETINNN